MRKQKKWLVAGLMCLMLSGVFICIFCIRQQNTGKSVITPVVFRSYGERIYYTQELVEERGIDEAELEKNLAILEEYIRRAYPETCWYISFFNQYEPIGTGGYEINFICYQLVENVVIADNKISIATNGNRVTDKVVHSYHVFDEMSLAQGELIGDKQLSEIVSERALSYYGQTPFLGQYHMTYTAEKRLVYDVQINEFSSMQIDAFSGEILWELFWDGVVTD